MRGRKRLPANHGAASTATVVCPGLFWVRLDDLGSWREGRCGSAPAPLLEDPPSVNVYA
jgi:hypothetical protein